MSTPVEHGLYRGSHPREINFRFLKRLKLKTIVSLAPKKLPELVNFCSSSGIDLRYFEVEKFKEGHNPLTKAMAQTVLEMIIVAHDAPIYIHCYDGTHITGMIIMCLRKLQCWDVSTVHAEFSRFMRGGIITNEESQFVSSFNGSGDGIGLPLHLPEWLWQGEHYLKHPTLRIKPHPIFIQRQLERQQRKDNQSLERVFEGRLGDALEADDDSGDDADDDAYGDKRTRMDDDDDDDDEDDR